MAAARPSRHRPCALFDAPAKPILRNVQPLFAELEEGGIAIAHNGNFTNGLTLRRQTHRAGAICQSTSDTEVVLHLIARSATVARRPLHRCAPQMEGAYSLVA
jgi:amidophosphoribosyltransferase